MSPAQKGTAAIGDEYMSKWMEYLHMQQPKPNDAVGVEVLLSVVDSNGNCYQIGTTTSSANGQFRFLWEPEIPGEYQVTATFVGSDSYYGSFAETSLGVTQAVAPPEQPQPQPAADYTMTMVYLGIAIIAAVAIIGALIVLMLRKR